MSQKLTEREEPLQGGLCQHHGQLLMSSKRTQRRQFKIGHPAQGPCLLLP